jgi:hypothetical protein
VTDFKKLSNITCQEYDDLDTVFMVIDALDELFPLSPGSEQNQQNSEHLRRVLRELVKMAKKNRKLKILVISRPTPDIESLLGKSPNIAITSQMNSSDIRRLVESRIDEEIGDCTKWGERLSGNDTLRSDLLSRLVQNADGMSVLYTASQSIERIYLTT